MAFFTLSYTSSLPWIPQNNSPIPKNSLLSLQFKSPIPISISIHSKNLHCCSAAKQNSVKKRRSAPSKKRSSSKKFESVEEFKDNSESSSSNSRYSPGYQPASLPNPPAGFVIDPNGKVVMVSSKRMVTMVDAANDLPLDCIIRRVFTSSQGDDCLLLCPVDTPIQILKSANADGWSAASDEEIEAILPAADYALAKIHMHLVYSGFCYTARGGFCYSEENIIEFGSDDQDVDGLPTEGVQITCFHQDGTHYMIYTPTDPLLFVAVKDKDGLLRIADDDLLEDPAIGDAIDEETEFNALVEEENALLESLLLEEEA
ncbi:hypothetical protein ACHQM5_022881 [Ranunculus cassubicifolius]